MNDNRISAGTISRTIILALALFNQFMIMSGKHVLPISDETINELISCIFTIVASVINWWKNNSFTKNAIEADNYLKALKEYDQEEIDENDEMEEVTGEE